MEDTSNLLTQDSASNSTSISLFPGDNSVLKLAERYKRSGSSSACRVCLKLTDFLLNAILITPLVTSYWAATWDIISLYIFPTDYIISYLFTFLISNTILIGVYMFQDELQRFHSFLRTRPRVYDTVQQVEVLSSPTSTSSFSSSTPSLGSPNNIPYYYDSAFLFRCLYSYLVANAYVAQWRTYWDIFDALTVSVHYMYFLVIALIALLLYRAVLNSSLETYTKTVPFSLLRDNNLDSYFIQWKRIQSDNVSLLFYFNIHDC
jgi:hypothetical protein